MSKAGISRYADRHLIGSVGVDCVGTLECTRADQRNAALSHDIRLAVGAVPNYSHDRG